jgi:acetyl esterase/lipase
MAPMHEQLPFGALVLSLILTASSMAAAGPSTAPAPSSPVGQPAIRLWSGDAPGTLGSADVDIPTLTPYLASPDKASGAAFVVCPGGGYQHLAIEKEGITAARWLNSIGIHAFILKYRLGPKYHHPVEMHDVQRAIRLVRARAKDWKIDPHRVGVMGFSAGGHLASTAATHFDAGQPEASDPIDHQSCRPDLAILVYPVITMGQPSTHRGSQRNLLGDDPDPKLLELLSNDKQVTPQTPPCFLVHGSDDKVVPVENSLAFVSACHMNKVPVELHIFEHGPHGFALGGNDPTLSTWPALAARWLGDHKFTRPK